ncbi:MAG: 4Fe-4S dicluster domain-containing protein [Candidatus Omnitrophota bacterium]|nr:4Fe-4S dicluster domain-containing protein [Candidatus Omnitrophota bacterium]
MSQNLYKITKKDLFDLFGRLSDNNRVLVSYLKGEQLYFDDFDPEREGLVELGGIRQSQPLKSFINPPRQNLTDEKHADPKPLIIAGVKGCDLSSLRLQDFVFLEGDVVDPSYSEGRNRALLIGCDCTYAKETCFCVAMEGAPYPRDYFDINLSPVRSSKDSAADTFNGVSDYFLVEVKSEKGSGLVNKFRMFFKGIDAQDIEIRQRNRDRVTGQIRDCAAKRGTKNTQEIKGAVKKNYNLAELWQDFASTCVECGACNLVCPTCHCFLLFDEKSTLRQKLRVDAEPVEASKDFAKRYRAWDACLYKTFARVAGGANPRKHLYERLRNRFEKKFDFFPQVLNYFACTGCGRCIDACPGDIDIREALKGLVDGKWNKPPNE